MSKVAGEIALGRLLASEQRRQLLRELRDSEARTSTMEELATALATDGNLERTRIALHHVHLPKLDACGIISYSRDSGGVQYPDDRELAGRLENLLAAIEAA